MTASRCQVCDRDNCPTRAAPPHVDAARTAHDDCAAHAIDWRARALAAESERNALFLDWRGLSEADEICAKCSGSGVRAYPSTATWHGGIGGQMVTSDVCDRCWGSGTADRPWPNLRALANRFGRGSSCESAPGGGCARALTAESERDALRLSTLTAAEDARRVCEEREQAALRMWRAATAQLDAVRAIVERLAEHDEAMTRGPWRAGDFETDAIICSEGDPSLFVPEAGRVLLRMNKNFPHGDDAAGIAALRNALPELLEAVRRG